ncbi:uncharacterized protein [Heterodontus francisci]|uniref:uncharacterized protein n=1 Tax=Heterodontus francisci TaxID=7792 RepID=UPI00355C1080
MQQLLLCGLSTSEWPLLLCPRFISERFESDPSLANEQDNQPDPEVWLHLHAESPGSSSTTAAVNMYDGGYYMKHLSQNQGMGRFNMKRSKRLDLQSAGPRIEGLDVTRKAAIIACSGLPWEDGNGHTGKNHLYHYKEANVEICGNHKDVRSMNKGELQLKESAYLLCALHAFYNCYHNYTSRLNTRIYCDFFLRRVQQPFFS